ncbi:hypothetical protein MHBO_003230 [Bonamia ostreae]|uniref:RNA polymerase sigma-70 region 4 domain-containing protein n=1 Tax=Bonamia ostreae TaxID=126728 RepID=A0ABV2AQG0_9EUKA
MNAKNKTKRQDVKNIQTLSEYKQYRDSLKLTDEQKELMDMVFVRGWSYNMIADTIGCAECTVKRKMRKILDLL